MREMGEEERLVWCRCLVLVMVVRGRKQKNTLGEEPLKAGARIFATSRRPGRSGSLSFKRARARWAQNYAAWDDDTWAHGGTLDRVYYGTIIRSDQNRL